jgi:hypothetical protein
VLRYGQVIGAARRAIPEGRWVKESDLVMPPPPALDSPPRYPAGRFQAFFLAHG